jgi:hypothetical protein
MAAFLYLEDIWYGKGSDRLQFPFNPCFRQGQVAVTKAGGARHGASSTHGFASSFLLTMLEDPGGGTGFMQTSVSLYRSQNQKVAVVQPAESIQVRLSLT